jgi:hypothetical protein
MWADVSSGCGVIASVSRWLVPRTPEVVCSGVPPRSRNFDAWGREPSLVSMLFRYGIATCSCHRSETGCRLAAFTRRSVRGLFEPGSVQSPGVPNCSPIECPVFTELWCSGWSALAVNGCGDAAGRRWRSSAGSRAGPPASSPGRNPNRRSCERWAEAVCLPRPTASRSQTYRFGLGSDSLI